MLIKRNCIIGLFLVFAFSTLNSQVQNLNTRLFKKSFLDLKIKFINQRGFDKSRDLILNSFDKFYLAGDTTIFIEFFVDVTGSYSCSLYSSLNHEIKCYDVINEYIGTHTIHRKIRKSSLCDLPAFIVRSVQNNYLESAIEKGRTTNYTPNTDIIITVAKKINGNFSIKSFKTNSFQLDN